MAILQINNLSKSFGSHQIIDGLNLTVPEHVIYGFVGKNGAGKTTTMKMILGLLLPDGGEILVNGEKVRYGETATNRFIGYLPDVPEFYGFMTPKEYLMLCGEITGMKQDACKKRAKNLLDLVGLSEANKRIQSFSRGMKQRLGIAQALLNSPKLLICDEPTSALDPVGRKEILDILSSVKETTTVLFSTHILSDVERICDETAFLHNGKIALHQTADAVKHGKNVSGIEIEFYRQNDAAHFASKYPGGSETSKTTLRYTQKTENDMSYFMQLLLTEHIPVQRLQTLEPTLEDLFLNIVQKEDN